MIKGWLPFFLKLSSLLVILAAAGICPDARAAVYYVDSGLGHDTHSGRSTSAPWKTIKKAAQTMVPGDTVFIEPGIYDERVIISTSGSEGKPITFRAVRKVVTRGFTIRANYVKVMGFEITDTPDYWDHGTGIHLEGQRCEITGNYIHDVTRLGIRVFSHDPDSDQVSRNMISGNRIIRAGLAGIEVYGRNNTIENNDISHILQHPPKWSNPGPMADADGMRFFGSGHIIRRNRIHDILMSDPGNVNPHIDCFQTWGPASNITIEQNLCENRTDGMQGFMISSERPPVRNIVIKNNVVETFRSANIFECEGVVFANNLCIGDLVYKSRSAYGIELHRCPNAMVANNVFYNVGGHSYPYLAFDVVDGLQVACNLVYMSDGRPSKRSSYVPRPTDLWQVDPKISFRDFTIAPDSPLIGRGMAVTGLDRDYHGNLRPLGAGIAIGPFEYKSR